MQCRSGDLLWNDLNLRIFQTFIITDGRRIRPWITKYFLRLQLTQISWRIGVGVRVPNLVGLILNYRASEKAKSSHSRNSSSGMIRKLQFGRVNQSMLRFLLPWDIFVGKGWSELLTCIFHFCVGIPLAEIWSNPRYIQKFDRVKYKAGSLTYSSSNISQDEKVWSKPSVTHDTIQSKGKIAFWFQFFWRLCLSTATGSGPWWDGRQGDRFGVSDMRDGKKSNQCWTQ